LGSDVDGLVRKESKYPRFSKKDPVPKFSLGMKFEDLRSSMCTSLSLVSIMQLVMVMTRMK
jgi:hypothetical protein